MPDSAAASHNQVCQSAETGYLLLCYACLLSVLLLKALHKFSQSMRSG
jgi:hypothetical protein